MTNWQNEGQVNLQNETLSLVSQKYITDERL